MQVLGLFIGALGIAVVAIALTALSLATIGVLPGGIAVALGIATALLGCGLFKVGYARNDAQQQLPIQQVMT